MPPPSGCSHVKPHDFRRFVGTELAKKEYPPGAEGPGAHPHRDDGEALHAR